MLTEWKGIDLIPIAADAALSPGDRVVIRFTWAIEGQWYRAYEWEQIDKLLEGRSDFRTLSYRMSDDYLDAEVEVLSVPSVYGNQSIFAASIAPIVVGAITIAYIATVFITVRYAFKGYIEQYKIDVKNKLIESGQAGPEILDQPSETGVIAQTGNTAIMIALAVLSVLILPKLFE